MIRTTLIVLVALVAGCFDSIVNNPCASGYRLVAGQCRASDAPDAGTAHDDGGASPDSDAGSTITTTDAGAGADALVCTLPEIVCDGACIDVSSDPDNCGACDRVCASGICQLGHCVGELSGHIVTIGHDYRSHNAAMARVLGNAVALAGPHDVGVARWGGTAATTAVSGTTAALTQAMISIGRPWHVVALAPSPSAIALDGIDVLVVDAQTGDADAARTSALPWASTIDGFLQRGGVVVVLEGANGVSHRFADGAGLYTIAAPLDSTGMPALVADASDAVVQQVVSPYLADTTSVVFPGVTGVIVTPSGSLVLHETRY